MISIHHRDAEFTELIYFSPRPPRLCGDVLSGGETAGRRHYRLLPRDRVEDMVFPVLDFEDELAREGLMVFFAQHLVAGRKIGTFFYFEAFERCNQLWRVVASLKLRFLDPEFEGVDRLEVRLHVAVGQRPRRIDLF